MAERRGNAVQGGMGRPFRFVLAVLVTFGLALAGSRVPEALARVDAFRVADFDLEGARYLTLDEAVRMAAIPPGASVWDDPSPWEASLRSHPLIAEIRVRRRLPATLVFEVREREPVALVPTPTLEPVDAAGRFLPIDPARHRLDLPVVVNGAREARGGTRWAPSTVRTLAGEVGRLSLESPEFMGMVSQALRLRDGSIVFRLAEPEVELRFHGPLTDPRLSQALAVLDDVLARDPERTPNTIDLRFDDQVVVRY